MISIEWSQYPAIRLDRFEWRDRRFLITPPVFVGVNAEADTPYLHTSDDVFGIATFAESWLDLVEMVKDYFVCSYDGLVDFEDERLTEACQRIANEMRKRVTVQYKRWEIETQ